MFVGIDTRMFHFCMGAKDEKFRIMCMNTDRYKIIYKNGPLYVLVLAIAHSDDQVKVAVAIRIAQELTNLGGGQNPAVDLFRLIC